LPIAPAKCFLLSCQKFNLEPIAAANIARLADGSFAQAASLINSSQDAEQHFDWFVRFMRLAYARNLQELAALSEEIAAVGREKQKNFLTYSIRMLRENLMMNMGKADLAYLTDQESGFSAKFHPFINSRNIFQLTEEFSSAYSDIERNGNGKIIFLDLGLKTVLLIKK
jgi:DNA polymerase-3 subunit delta'